MDYLEQLDERDPDDYYDRRRQEIDYWKEKYGAKVPGIEWIFSPRLTWERNPFFIGPSQKEGK